MYATILVVLSLSYITSANFCYNNLPCCAGWAEKGHCDSSTFVKTNCRAACGLCTPSYSNGECNDYFSWCKNGAARGTCRRKVGNWMDENCRKSCDKCDHPRHAGCPDTPPVDGCDENEEFIRTCGSCDHFCSESGLSEHKLCWDAAGMFTGEPCQFQCRCKKGYIEDWTRRTGKKCILPKECVAVPTTTETTTTTTSKPAKKCGVNEELRQSCGSCDQVCTSDGLNRVCWDSMEMFTGQPCPTNCLCKPGYIKDWTATHSTSCIRPEQCAGRPRPANLPQR